MITSATKTLMSRWDTDCRDICKFQLRVVTKEDIDGQPSSLHVDWAGFAFGVHPKNCQKFKNNFLFANDVNGAGKVAIRGHHMKPRKIINFSEDSTFVYQPPNHNCCKWSVTKQNDHLFELRSDCCPYAFNWMPNGEHTEWEIFVSDGQKYVDGTMEGMCSDCDGNIMNDWTKCFDWVILPLDNSSVPIISDSCIDGRHHGNHPNGGTKLGP